MQIFIGYIIPKEKKLNSKARRKQKCSKKKYKQNKHGIKFIFMHHCVFLRMYDHDIEFHFAFFNVPEMYIFVTTVKNLQKFISNSPKVQKIWNNFGYILFCILHNQLKIVSRSLLSTNKQSTLKWSLF